MADGYRLRKFTDTTIRLIGRFTFSVTIQTFAFLERNKMIEDDCESTITTTYRLTDLGKSKVTPKKN